MFEKITEATRRSIFFARYEAAQFGNKAIEPYHLLLGIVRESDKLKTRVLGTATLDDLRAEFAHFDRLPKISVSVDLPLNISGKHVLAYAAEEAHRAGSALIDAEHLLAGLLRESTPASEVLAKRGITLPVIRRDIMSAQQRRKGVKRVPAAMRILQALASSQVTISVTMPTDQFTVSFPPEAHGPPESRP
jgi:ATP-dependent Clp protease ATP-binding subunit ClpC